MDVVLACAMAAQAAQILFTRNETGVITYAEWAGHLRSRSERL